MDQHMERLLFSRAFSSASPSSTSQGCCQFRHFAASYFAYRPRPRLLAALLAQPGSIASAVSSYASATDRGVTCAIKRLTSSWMSSPSVENLMRRTRHPQTMARKSFTSCAGSITSTRKQTKGDEPSGWKNQEEMNRRSTLQKRGLRMRSTLQTRGGRNQPLYASCGTWRGYVTLAVSFPR